MAYAQKITHFYCWTCRDYHPKTHPHYASQKRRLARRKAARAEETKKEHGAEQRQ